MKNLNSSVMFSSYEVRKMNYYLAQFSVDNYISGKAVSSPHSQV